MGGDFAPKATVAGALYALAELDPSHTIQLVVQTAIVEAQLREARRRSIADVAAAREHLATAVRETERLDAAILAYTGNGNGSLEALEESGAAREEAGG